jgi:hypothetical protein
MGDLRKLLNKEHHNFHSSPDITKLLNQGGWGSETCSMNERGERYKISGRKI